MRVIRETYKTPEGEVIPILTEKIIISENASMDYWRKLQEKCMFKAEWRNDVPSVTSMSREIHIGTATGNSFVFRRIG